MGEIRIFRPRPHASRSTAPVDVRSAIEEAAQAALNTADSLIALLDRMDWDTDREDGGDAEPSLGAPEGHASQVVWLRGSTSDAEQDTAR